MSLSVFDGHLYVVCRHYDFVYSYVAASRTCCLSEFHPDRTSWMINTACSTYVVLHCRLDLFFFFLRKVPFIIPRLMLLKRGFLLPSLRILIL